MIHGNEIVEKNRSLKLTSPRLFYLNSVDNNIKERGPGTQDSKKIRTKSLRSKHVGGEREIKTMHKTCQWETVKSKAESDMRSWRHTCSGRGTASWRVWKHHWRPTVLSCGFLEPSDQNPKSGFGQKIPSTANTNIKCERCYEFRRNNSSGMCS